MMNVTRILAVVAFGLAMVGARASDTTPTTEQKHHRGEFAALDAQLKELDKNNDGRLDDGELRGALHALKKLHSGVVVGEVDANKDSRIDHGELKKFLDQDKDNKIDHGELRRFMISIKTQHPDIYAKVVETMVPMPRGEKHNK
jgi:Ca2+-binding EF-hand superfamily protein